MNKKLCAAAVFSVAAGFGAAAWAEVGGMILMTPDEIQWTESPALPPGAKVAVIEGKMSEEGPITARIRFPADYTLPPHWHPGVERVTVLSGTFNYGMGDMLDMQKTKALGPGSLVVMPPKMSHFVWTNEETVIQLNVMGPWAINYVNPADDPRKK